MRNTMFMATLLVSALIATACGGQAAAPANQQAQPAKPTAGGTDGETRHDATTNIRTAATIAVFVVFVVPTSLLWRGAGSDVASRTRKSG